LDDEFGDDGNNDDDIIMYDSDGLEGAPNRLRPLRSKRLPLNNDNSASDGKTTKRNKKLRGK